MVRAFSRVLTHELAHRFLRTSKHTDGGVLEAAWQGRDLVRPSSKTFLFSPEQGRRLRSFAARDHRQAPFASLLLERELATETVASKLTVTNEKK
jgi:hypothetical protein